MVVEKHFENALIDYHILSILLLSLQAPICFE